MPVAPHPASRPIVLRVAANLPWSLTRRLAGGRRWRVFAGACRRLGGWSASTLGWHQVRRGPLAGIWLRVTHVNSLWMPLGVYEPRLTQLILKNANVSPACLWDIGANIGMFSLLFAKQGGRVVALEPDSENFARLTEHLAANMPSSEHVHAHAVAAGASSGRGVVVRTMSGAESTVMTGASAGSDVATCDVVTLDSLLSSECQPTIVKVDVEGAEADVLAGADRLLRIVRPTWIIEMHNAVAERGVRATLAAADYDITEEGRTSPVEPYPAWVMAVPASR